MPNRGEVAHPQGMMSASRGDGGVYGRTPQALRSVPSRYAVSIST